jgi:hypothetical protein
LHAADSSRDCVWEGGGGMNKVRMKLSKREGEYHLEGKGKSEGSKDEEIGHRS